MTIKVLIGRGAVIDPNFSLLRLQLEVAVDFCKVLLRNLTIGK